MSRTYFLTGALGCIGAWVVKTLVDRGDTPVVFDLGDDPRRIRDLLDEDAFARVQFVQGNVTDGDAVHRAVEDSGAQRIIHLAGLQVPFCKADPAKGARVNVLGTIHLFQAAADLGLDRIAYASSAAVYGPDDRGRDGGAPDETTECHPTTHYGVYKRANEGTAQVFHADNGVSSAGIRPLTVYGVGRDQGMTSDPTRAMKAAVVGRPFHVRFTGATDYQFVGDCAATFVEAADRAPEGAQVYNLHGESIDMARILELICAEEPRARDLITVDGPHLPIPPLMDGSRIARDIPGLPSTSIEEGVRATMARFRELQAEGRLRTAELDE